MSKTFYLTTTLPYVNADPHIGHALEFIQADAIARYQRQKLGKENVFFNVGTDEHGLKMYTKAKEQGLTPKEFVSKYAERFKEFCRIFNIDYDFFYRTSEPYHYGPAQKFWEASLKAGDIYKRKYEGLYCVGHESFITEKELVDGKCPDHGVAPIPYSEENYFFRLSKYADAILKHLDENPNFIKPTSKLGELKSFIKQGLDDISISRLRKNLPWGVPVPGDEDQVMYVWFDALTNYVISVGYGTDAERFQKWWPVVQLCGPDNLRFQGAIWQGMLASAGLEFSKAILVHGTILGPDGRKMSKSLGNVISPFTQLEKYGAEVVRYYLLSGLTTYGDSTYSEKDLVAKYNSELANNYGNLLNRVIHLANKYSCKLNDEAKVTAEFKQTVDQYQQQIHAYYDDYELYEALQTASKLSAVGNQYIDEQKPWKLTDPNQIEIVLNNLGYLLAVINNAYEPAVPESVAKAKEALTKVEPVILFPKIEVGINAEPAKQPLTLTSQIADIPVAYKTLPVVQLDTAKVNEYVQQQLQKFAVESLPVYLQRPQIQGYADLHTEYSVTEDASPVGLAKLAAIAKFPRINPIIDLYNITSLTSGIAFGVHDTQRISGNVVVKVLNNPIQFTPLGKNDAAEIPAGHYAAIDDANQIICYAEAKQSSTTKFTNKTKEFLVYAEGNKQTTQAQVDAALQEFLDKLEEFKA